MCLCAAVVRQEKLYARGNKYWNELFGDVIARLCTDFRMKYKASIFSRNKLGKTCPAKSPCCSISVIFFISRVLYTDRLYVLNCCVNDTNSQLRRILLSSKLKAALVSTICRSP